LGASTYIFGALGKGYADVAAFEGAGVDIHFQEYKHPEYPQQGVQFIPCLSIVDLLFNCGDRSGDILMSANISKAELLARGRRGVLRVSSDPEEGKREGSFCGTQGSFPVKRLSVLIRADASETIGTGHVMRMLALAQALKDKGELVTLVTVGTPDSLVMRWEAEGIRVVRLAVSHPDPRDAMLTLHLACQSHADWVIADGYHFDVEFHRQIRQAGLALLVVDDYAHLANYDADLVLNQNISAVDLAYHLPEYTRPLLGLSYVMLRRDFRRASESLAPARAVAQRVLITLGGGDEHNVTGLVVEALSGLTGNRLILDVVIGATYAHRTILEGQLAHSPHEIHLHVNTCDMPNLMRQADIAVSGAGSTCWELAAMGVPTCLVTLAENQRAMAERLGEIGAMVSLGWHYQLGAARVVEVVGELLRNIDLRARMRAICLPLVDGLGCERIIEQLKVSRARQP